MKKIEKINSKNNKLTYDPSVIEPKWQSIWEKEGTYHPDLTTAKRPFYNLMMFPYPSAEGLHVGSMYTFSGVDAYGRFKRMQGYDVFEPIGLDGFGIHSENHAIKMGTHPIEHARTTEETFYRQLREIGNGFDWLRKLETYDPNYYKWTQWLFAELFKMGLAYRKKAPVNFCPSCKTVLADEQVLDGKCERCGSVVEKKNLEQWFFRITDYADRLLNNIDSLNWTEKIKTAQREWIGKKEGIVIKYPISNFTRSASSGQESQISNKEAEVEVFTTRPDTNYGATFIAVAPEHGFVASILNGEIKVDSNVLENIRTYVEKTKKKTEIDRQAEGREKTGVFTGFYALNQLTGYKMPIWISDFVLMGFGTGAVVGVPGHDKRDFEFASKFGLEIIRVVVGKDGDKSEITRIDQVQEEEGTMVNSDFLNGMDIHKATKKIMDYMEEKGYGKRVSTYHLRDWLISRQRYWGPPIPMVHCESCAKKGISWFDSEEAKNYSKGMGISNIKSQISNKKEIGNWKLEIGNSREAMAGWFPVPEKDLPVKLPDIKDFKPLGTGKAPLANHPEFYETKCPNCGSDAVRETDVSDTFLDSSWYFFRYLSTDRKDVIFDSEVAKKWLPVTMYIGGAEHAVMHLLYSRFIWKVLIDLGYVDFSGEARPRSAWEEPFERFYAHGLIIKDGAKMSKSKGNVVNPDVYIKKYGADTLRTYLRFLGPFDQTGDFRDSGVEGMNRFLKKIWNLFKNTYNLSLITYNDKERLRMMHQTVKQVTEEMENLRFNTSIAHLMSWYNFLARQDQVSLEEAEVYLKLLAPFAPHMTEELFQSLKGKAERVKGKGEKELHASPFTLHPSIHVSSWPQYDEKYLVADIVKIPVQVNGKFRSMIEVAAAEIGNKQKIEDLARKDEKVAKFLKGQKIKQAIYVEGKVLNFVVDTAKS